MSFKSLYDFGITPRTYRKPLCQEDMRGILDSLDKNYLASYEAAIASLFSCSEDFVTSVLIVSELSELKNYFNHLFGLLFKFPQLSHYRPILLFFILEIDKCVTQFIEWQQLHTHNPKLSSSFLGSIGHIDKPHLTKELQRLFDDFVKYRSGLLDLMSNESLFSNYQDITDFKHEITDTVELLARCKGLHYKLVNDSINSPLLSYMSAMLLMYNFLLRPDFINGLIDVSSHKDYTLFIQKDAFTETARSLYGSWGGSLTTDFDPRRYYFRSTDPYIRNYRYSSPYILTDDSAERYGADCCYLSLDDNGHLFPLGGRSQNGVDKTIFKSIAFMEEELDLKVIRVLIDPETFENLISEQPDQDLKTELTSYFSNSEAICHLQSRCSQDGGFIVTITDCDEELIDQFIFSPEEMHDLQK